MKERRVGGGLERQAIDSEVQNAKRTERLEGRLFEASWISDMRLVVLAF